MSDANEIDYRKVVFEIEAWLKLCAKQWAETGTPCRYSDGKAEAYQTAFYKINDLRRNTFIEQVAQEGTTQVNESESG